jgi:hypothetical protein
MQGVAYAPPPEWEVVRVYMELEDNAYGEVEYGED